jgi:hypothetical protein
MQYALVQTVSAAVMCGIHPRKLAPLIRQIVQCEYRRHRADRNACATVDAFHRIDEELLRSFEIRLILAWMNAIDRAGVYTRRIFDPNAWLGDYI